MSRDGVHVSHCCAVHGCKYGDLWCPVQRLKLLQEFECEFCVEDSETYNVYYRVDVLEPTGMWRPVGEAEASILEAVARLIRVRSGGEVAQLSRMKVVPWRVVIHGAEKVPS